MSDTHTNKDLKKEIGSRLQAFRKEIMKRSNLSLEAFCKETGIPVDTLESYEKGDAYPAHDDLIKISRFHGMNLNWLFNENGGMYFHREKDMEEMIRYIESDATGRYEHYKMLLKSMQVPEMEDFVFYVHGVLVDLISRVEFKLSQGDGDSDLLSEMTEDVDYQWPRVFGKEPDSSVHRS